MTQLFLSLLPKLIDLLLGVFTLIIMWFKWKQPGLTPRELLKKLEEKERQIIKMQVEIEGWKMHHKRANKK